MLCEQLREIVLLAPDPLAGAAEGEVRAVGALTLDDRGTQAEGLYDVLLDLPRVAREERSGEARRGGGGH